MPTWQTHFIEVNGIQLHYTRTGGDKPTVVMSHGFSDHGLCWKPVAQALEDDYDLIMVDARGHGRSDDPEEGYGTDTHAADLAALITALALDHPPVLGHSMGAATALMLASTYPDMPRAILLEDPPSRWTDPNPTGSRPDWLEATRKRLTMLKRKTHAELMAYQRQTEPNWAEAEMDPWAYGKLRLSFNVLNRVGAPALDWRAIVQKISCPVLLITADTDAGAIVSAEAAADLQSLLPQTKVAHIPGAGHSIRREQPEAYLAAVRPFLAEVT